MSRFVLFAILAAAVVVALHSSSVLLALAAVSGACGVVSLAFGPIKAPYPLWKTRRPARATTAAWPAPDRGR